MVKHNHLTNDEISVFDIIHFLVDNWKSIFFISFIGILASWIYLSVTIPQYEASALIEMAQVRNSDVNSKNNASFINVEPPSLLIERLKNPSTYPPEVIKACRFKDENTSSEMIAKLIKTSALKDLSSVVTITIRRDHPEHAKNCMSAVFEMIKNQQASLAKPYQDETRSKIVELQSRLQKNQDYIIKAEKAKLHQTIYLAHRDESIYLMSQIDELRRLLSLERAARLASPIYASHNQVSPNKNLTISLGSILSLILGVIFAIGWRIIKIGIKEYKRKNI